MPTPGQRCERRRPERPRAVDRLPPDVAGVIVRPPDDWRARAALTNQLFFALNSNDCDCDSTSNRLLGSDFVTELSWTPVNRPRTTSGEDRKSTRLNSSHLG